MRFPVASKTILRAGAVVLAVGGLAAAYQTAAGHPGAAPGPAAGTSDRPVFVTTVHFSPDRSSRSFVATIRPRVETDQAFRVGGKIAKRGVDVGQNVAAGDILARLDDVDLRLQKDQAEAELSASRMALEQASADERRGAELRAKGWTAQAAYDRQRTAAEEARGRNKRAQRAVELATNALDYAVLRADSDGVVTAAPIEPGQVVAAGQPAIRIARKGEKEALVAIPEAFVADARAGTATLSMWTEPGRAQKASLREMSPMADAATRTFAARYSLPEADQRMALGMSATLTIAGVSGAVARLPLSALFDQGRGPALWTVANDGSLALKATSVVRYDGADVVVTGGVADGDRVVTLGVQKLDAGQKVRTISQLAF